MHMYYQLVATCTAALTGRSPQDTPHLSAPSDAHTVMALAELDVLAYNVRQHQKEAQYTHKAC